MKKISTLFLLLGLAFSSYGQKNILIEKFTNLYCGACPDKSILLTNLEEEYPQLIWISHYWPSTFEWNPLPYPGAAEMWDAVSISGTPNAIVDRTPYNNSLGTTSTSWETRIQQQQDLESYVDIEFTEVDFDASSRLLNFTVTMTFYTLQTNMENFRLNLYVTEDNVIWRQSSYYNNTPGHPLEGLGDMIQEYSHQNLIRAVLGGNWGEENIIPDNPVVGLPYSKSYVYDVLDAYVPSNIELTAAVSQYDESNYLNRPVLNAERVALKDFIITNTNEVVPSSFNAFPNPTAGVINLQFKKLPTSLTLEDMSGSLIKQFSVDGLNKQLDLSNMPSGQYILHIRDGDKIISQKIIIQ